MWPFTKNGEYSVRTGYFRMKNEDSVVNNGPSTSCQIDERLWNFIWKLKMLSKIRIFM